MSRKVATSTEKFNGTSNKSYCFLSEVDDEIATFGLIIADKGNLVEFVEKYAKHIGMKVALSAPDEITLANMQNLLGGASRHGYLEDDDEILERFGMAKLGRRYSLDFGENLVNCKAKRDELFDSARKLFADKTLIPELERIYAGKKSSFVKGHPVHYFIETDDRDSRRDMCMLLLDALYANARLESCRYSRIEFRHGQSFSRMAFESLYKIAEGGAIVINYLPSDDTEEDDTFEEQEIIESICEMTKRYRNKVLTVICLPRECKRLKAQFCDCLGTMSFVEVREDSIAGANARDFLASLAKERHIRTDKNLFLTVQAEKSYFVSELVAMFEEWYNEKLKRTVFPQYNTIATAGTSTKKGTVKGSAYDELSEMIGLTEAKAVIKKALNFYKMQRLYAEKGVKQDTPAMHMMFTGNPGTAKTTVARLFARIMKENGLLSRGQLIEVGRGELVGKYVGWTAQTVIEKFREASGGVLFIDEAYSLVDDRDGSFGDEAINTIVQEMENHREDVVVIFAGYSNKMKDFLDKNPGLRSRISFHIPFADYTSAELCRIAELLSQKNGMRIDASAVKKLEQIFDIAKNDSDFGNGRYVRKLFEQAKMNQATRLLEKNLDSITVDEITTITAEDIILPEVKKSETRRIGFC